MNAVTFDCGACVPVAPGQTVQAIADDHNANCALCLDEQIERLESRIEELRHQLYQLHQKKWEARVDSALTEARRTA